MHRVLRQRRGFGFGREDVAAEEQGCSAARTVLIVILRYTCTDTLLFSSLGDSFSQGLQVAGDLRSATLKTTVTTADAVSTRLYDFDIDLTWTGTGPAVHQNTKETFRDRDLGIFIKSHTKGVTVPAEAVGTVVGTSVGLEGNVTPEPSVDAEIQRRDDSTLTIEKTM